VLGELDELEVVGVVVVLFCGNRVINRMYSSCTNDR
jgi:hypothetical protein